MMDIDEPSLAQLCYRYEGQELHALLLQEALPQSSVDLILNRDYESLRALYHNLSAPIEDQKRAFEEGKILLSPWELLCLTLFKAVITVSGHLESAAQTLYSCVCDSKNNLHSQRSDQHRILTVVICNLYT